MHYSIVAYSNGRTWNVEVTSDQHDDIKRAMLGLLRILGMEEKFDMLAENYDELEASLESASRRSTLFGRPGWGEFTAEIYTTVRRLNNFMSAARLYLDQVDHDLSSLFGKSSDERKAYNGARNAEYDRRIGYRALEALRSYAQHRDIPMHALSYNSERVEEAGRSYARHTIQPTVSLSRIRSEGNFKENVLKELEASGSEADLKPLIRDYMTGLQAVHSTLRAATQDIETQWVQRVVAAHAKVRDELEDPTARVYDLVWRGGSGEVIESTQVFDDFLGRLTALRRKNVAAYDFTRQVRSS